jgi:hypothetical protein
MVYSKKKGTQEKGDRFIFDKKKQEKGDRLKAPVKVGKG